MKNTLRSRCITGMMKLVTDILVFTGFVLCKRVSLYEYLNRTSFRRRLSQRKKVVQASAFLKSTQNRRSTHEGNIDSHSKKDLNGYQMTNDLF